VSQIRETKSNFQGYVWATGYIGPIASLEEEKRDKHAEEKIETKLGGITPPPAEVSSLALL
jgi:hypothetical protein